MPAMQAVPLILLSVALSATAQIMLKLGVRGASAAAGGESPAAFLISAGLNPYVFAGVCMHVAALVVWLFALRNTDVSYAYPFIALGFTLVLLMSALWLGEPINAWRIAGVVLISGGILMVGRS
jgi:drug/metabolite transporter (DMT)-like permease